MPFSFVALGDTQTGHQYHRSLVDRAVTLSPDFVLHVGDFVASGDDEAQWDVFFAIERDLLRQSPLFGVLGNHEENSRNYFDAFHLLHNERWYSFDYGSVHFTALQIDGSADYKPGSDQCTWLEEDLSRADALWKIVFFHIPPYSSGKHQGDRDVRDTLTPLFVQYGVDLVFSGHDHDYERIVIGDQVYIVTGGGGAPLYGRTEYKWYTMYFASVYHFVSVTVNGGTLTAVGVELDGTQFDVFTLTKTYQEFYLPIVLHNYGPSGSTLLPPMPQPVNRVVAQ